MSRRNEVITGAFVLAGTTLLVAGALWLSEARFGKEDRELTATFSRVGQIKPGNTVTLLGVPVGEVAEVRLGDTGGVVVTLRVRGDVQLPEDPVVVLEPASLFGEWQAAIEPTSERPEVARRRREELPPGHLPGVMQADFASISEYAQEIAANLRAITDRFEVAFDENTARDLSRAITNFSRASDELVALLERQRVEFGSFTADLAEAGEAVRKAAAEVDRTASRLADATAEGELEAIFAHTRDATADLDTLARSLRLTVANLDRGIARADSAVRIAHELLAGVHRGEGSLGRLTGDAVLYENTTAALAELRALLDDLKENPRKYFNFSIF